MKKRIIITLLFNLLYADGNCNIEYYKMMSNRDYLKYIKIAIVNNNFKKAGCISKSDCLKSLKSLRDLDNELLSKYYKCRGLKDNISKINLHFVKPNNQ